MPKLELTPAEAELLREVAEEALAGVRREIGHTDNRAYRDRLRWRESLLESLLERMGGAVTVPAG